MKLIPLKKHRFETLPSCPGQGYVHCRDSFTAQYLPGRNVVIVTATELRSPSDREQWQITATLQTGEWKQLSRAWESLQVRIVSAEDDQHARAEGVDAYSFMSSWLCENGLNAVAQATDLLA